MVNICDCKEIAPCEMVIHYTVDENDFISYNDINGRGILSEKCKHCTWRNICKPSSHVKAYKERLEQSFADFRQAAKLVGESKICEWYEKNMISIYERDFLLTYNKQLAIQ